MWYLFAALVGYGLGSWLASVFANDTWNQHTKVIADLNYRDGFIAGHEMGYSVAVGKYHELTEACEDLAWGYIDTETKAIPSL